MPRIQPFPSDPSVWSAQPLFSTWIVTPANLNAFEFFSYSRAMDIPGTGQVAMRHHTNVPRSGFAGLPQEWEYVAGDWYAHVNGKTEMAPEVERWAQATTVRFEYNARPYYEASLHDVIKRAELPHNRELDIAAVDEARISAESIAETLRRRGLSVIHMRSNLNYRATVDTPVSEMNVFGEWLKSGYRAWATGKEATMPDLNIRLSLFGAIKRVIV